VIKIFSAFNGSLIDLKSASHPWGSCRLVVALRALLLVFFVGVVFFAWVVLILFYQEKVPASGSAETLSPRSITCARYPKTGT
jgi:cell division septal protein FtsQ